MDATASVMSGTSFPGSAGEAKLDFHVGEAARCATVGARMTGELDLTYIFWPKDQKARPAKSSRSF
jgi:hypothetical protein